MKKAILAVLVLVVIVLVVIVAFPKKTYDLSGSERVVCDCLGSTFWYGTRCVGFPVACSSELVEEQDSHGCTQPTCSEVIEKIGEFDQELSATLSTKIGSDILLVIDVSQSMEGDKLAAAKSAAKQLVADLQQDEHIGIIGFNNASRVVHEFSADKDALTKSIDGMTVAGGTKYVPALEAAQSLFSSQQRENTKKGLIFLSDGVPDDDMESILSMVGSLQDEGIVLFTIGFGVADDDANILLHMAYAKEQLGTDRHRVFADDDNISAAFSEAWERLTLTQSISLVPVTQKRSFSSATLSSFGVQALLDQVVLSGFADEATLCVPDLSIVAYFNGSPVTMVPSNHHYRLPDKSVLPGTYNVSVQASFRANHQGSCLFSGSLAIGTVTVSNVTNHCDTVSCAEVEETLGDFSVALEEGVVLPRQTGYGRVVMLVDGSESMRPYEAALVRGLDRLNRLLSSGDERGLIVFNDESRLVIPLTQDKDEFSERLSLSAAGTTQIIPALAKTSRLFSDNKSTRDVAVILTDGVFHDAAGEKGIVAAAHGLVDDGVCLFILGYGTELLRDRDAQDMLEELSGYSQSRLHCGGFSYAPQSDDLALVVTEMFGGALHDDAPLQVLVDRSVQGRSLAAIVRVVSSQTGLHLPVKSDASCVPAPVLSVRLVSHGVEVPVAVEERDEGLFFLSSGDLLPGKYTFFVDASLPVAGCDAVVGSYEDSFIVTSGATSVWSWSVLGLLVVLVMLAFFLASRVLKKAS